MGVVRSEGNTIRGRNRLFLVRVATGTAGYMFLGANELDARCPAEIQVSATLAACVGSCQHAYDDGMAHCADGCSPYEYGYNHCVEQCGATVTEYPIQYH